jgi:hypothetical protein
MFEMFPNQPLTVQASCATSVGDELRITYQNDPTSHQDEILGFCDQVASDGEGFYLNGTRWGVAQIARDGAPDAELTDDLAGILGTEPVQCGD